MKVVKTMISFAIACLSCIFIKETFLPVSCQPKESRMNQEKPLLILSLVIAATTGIVVAPSHARDHDHEIPLSAVIMRSDGVGYGTIRNALSVYCRDIHFTGSTLGDAVRVMSYQLEAGTTQREVHKAIQGLVSQGMLLMGEANFTAHEVDGQSGSVWVTDISANMYAFNNQYASQMLGLVQAHSLSRGAGVVVAIIDSGFDPTHEAVQGPLTAWQWDFVENDAFPLDAGDGIDNDNDGEIDDGVGHGTYVTALVRLVAPEARLMHLRVLDDEGSSDTFRLSSAIHSAIDHGADVINVSVSTEFDSSTLSYAIARAKAAGIIVVAAMGNEGVDAPTLFQYPAASPDCYAVCATDHLDIKGAFSNFGECADYSVCGVSSLSPTGTLELSTSILGPIPGGGYAHWSGTSISAAFLSGAVALVRAQYPEWPNETVPAGAVADTVMSMFDQTAVSIDALNPNYVGLLGIGRVSVGETVILGPPAFSFADLDRNGFVGGSDLAMVLSLWGPCDSSVDCEADFNGNGWIDGPDLTVIFANWN